jgi:predicted esterase
MLQQDLSLTAEIKLYYDVFVPETAPPQAPVLLAVHGYGAHKRYMMREAQMVAPQDFVIASIQAPHQHFRPTPDGYRIGFGWLTEYNAAESVALHHKFINDVIERLAAEQTIDAGRVFLYGFSQACALNFRYALTFPERIRGVIGVCGGIPGDLETNPQYRPTAADTFYLYNDDDEFYPLEKYEAFVAKLENYLPNFQSKLYESKHEIIQPMRDDIRAWLAAQETH